ncbi:hypothetical protein T11_4546, partial [Trichinella zimbabwensis]
LSEKGGLKTSPATPLTAGKRPTTEVRRLYLPFVGLRTTLLRGMVVKQLRQVEYLMISKVHCSRHGRLFLESGQIARIHQNNIQHWRWRKVSLHGFLLKSHFHNQ